LIHLLNDALNGMWRTRNVGSILLWPLSWVYRSAMAVRAGAYRSGWFSTHRFDVSVIVVGNISVGGTGKTPIVAAIANHLREHGWSPGIVSRGYGGKAKNWPQAVTPTSSPNLVGDEPVLLARRTHCPVVVAPDRPEAVRRLLAENNCDVVISDDGLQHLALHRDVEIAVVDTEFRLGNGFCLPAGPLREPASRLDELDYVICDGKDDPGYHYTLEGDTAVNLADTELRRPLVDFSNATVHAVAGIGRPSRFFEFLRRSGLEVVEHPFPDHHRFSATDLAFTGDDVVLMTQKDAVKCESVATGNMWYVPVDAMLDTVFYNELIERLNSS
jgi:tetraacyldisaccharide 4'-kinase